MPDPSSLTIPPDYDAAAVERRLNGDRTAPITKADRIEIVSRARARGLSLLDIERVTGITKAERYLLPTQDGAA